jgi:transposase, IS6 family
LQGSLLRYNPPSCKAHQLLESPCLKQNQSPFKWHHFEPALIPLCVRGYCSSQLSYRDLEAMMRERGGCVDHPPLWSWGQRQAPEINKRMRPYLKMSGRSDGLDQTYVKVGTEWK